MHILERSPVGPKAKAEAKLLRHELRKVERMHLLRQQERMGQLTEAVRTVGRGGLKLAQDPHPTVEDQGIERTEGMQDGPLVDRMEELWRLTGSGITSRQKAEPL